LGRDAADSAREDHGPAPGGGNAVHLPLTTQFAENLSVSEDQVVRINDALDELQNVDERLARAVRLGCGVYGLAFTSGLSDRPVLFHPHGFIGAARTALTKLGVAWEPTERELAYQEGRTTEISEVPAVRIRRRFSRRLSFGQTELVVER
jgi:hypothetical protein